MSLLLPLIVFVVWLGFVIYMIQLATRLVAAVEHIARRMDQPPASPGMLGPRSIQ